MSYSVDYKDENCNKIVLIRYIGNLPAIKYECIKLIIMVCIVFFKLIFNNRKNVNIFKSV